MCGCNLFLRSSTTKTLGIGGVHVWVNFAKTGNPNGPGLPHWPAFSASSQRVMYLDARPHAGPVPNLEKLKVLDAYFTWSRQRERSPAQTQH